MLRRFFIPFVLLGFLVASVGCSKKNSKGIDVQDLKKDKQLLAATLLRYGLIADYLDLMDARLAKEPPANPFARQYWKDEKQYFETELQKLKTGLQQAGQEIKQGVDYSRVEELFVEAGVDESVLKNLRVCLANKDRALAECFKKLHRLADISDNDSSEIKKIDPTEITGAEKMPARTFLLTIDDGPYQENQKAILDRLEAAGVKAIFFFTCRFNPNRDIELLRPYVEKGHDLGNHSLEHTHRDWPKGVTGYDEMSALIEKVFKSERKWYRAPGGSRHQKFLDMVKARRGRHMLWNVDSRDWRKDFSEQLKMASSVLVSVMRDHGIIVFHEVYPDFPPRLIGGYASLMQALRYEFIEPAKAWKLYR